MFRNEIVFILGRRMGLLTPRTKFCELLLNGEYLGLYAFTEKNGIWWSFYLKSTHECIGYGGIFNINQTDNNAEIGYGLLQPYWGQGYISEIVSAIVSFALQTARIHRLYAIVLPGNEASIRVLKNNGFKQEGILKDNAYARKQYFDNLIFGLINKN